MKQYSINLTKEEKKNILDQHKNVYDGFVTQYVSPNQQPLYVQDFANDKDGITVSNKGVVKTYMNTNINEGVEELVSLGPVILQLYAAFLLTRNMTTEVDDSGQITDWWINFKKTMFGIPKKVKDFVSSIPDRIENGVDEIKFQLNKKELSEDADKWLRENIENDSELQSKMKNLQDEAKDYNEKINQLNDKLNMNDYFKERYKDDKSQKSQLLSPEKINKYKQTEEALRYKLKYINKKKNDLAELVEEKMQKLKEELPSVYRIVIEKFTEMAKYDNFEKSNNDIIYELELDEEIEEMHDMIGDGEDDLKHGVFDDEEEEFPDFFDSDFGGELELDDVEIFKEDINEKLRMFRRFKNR